MTINGTLHSFTSDASATANEISTGLRALINAGAQNGVVDGTGWDDLGIEPDVAGTAFNLSANSNFNAFADDAIQANFSTSDITLAAAGSGLSYGGAGRAVGSTTATVAVYDVNNYLSTSTCTNCTGGDDANVNAAPSNPLSYFYSPTNSPMTSADSWDFTNVWRDNSGTSALPTLR